MATPDKWNGYKYSGKELQKEMGLNWGDHENRMLDHTVGRWWVPDPLSEERYDISNYAYASNNPINRTDPNGMLDGWYEDELERMIFDASINSQQDLENAGIAGTYLGDTGYGIDAVTGNMLGYNSDGSITDMGANRLSGVTVQLSRHEQIMSNPTVQKMHQTQARFLYGPEAMFVYSFLPVGGAAGAAGKIFSGASKVFKVAKPIAKVAAKGGQGGLNLFKWGAKQTTKSTGWKTGDYMLHLPNKGTPKLNWKANYGALRREMGLGKPIFDSYRLPNGNLIPTGGFLNAERYILQSRGWIYSPTQGAWLPPLY
jgi:RHS repeat-associated protein